MAIPQADLQDVLDDYFEDSYHGQRLEDAPPVARPQSLHMSTSSGSGDPGSEPNSTTITAPDMFPNFFWLDQYSSPFAYPSFYAAGSSSAQDTNPFPEQSMQQVQPAPISDQNLAEGDENNTDGVEDNGTKEVSSTRQVFRLSIRNIRNVDCRSLVLPNRTPEVEKPPCTHAKCARMFIS